jgi:hypothetical protein
MKAGLNKGCGLSKVPECSKLNGEGSELTFGYSELSAVKTSSPVNLRKKLSKA